jgi:type I restriction enzyme S subunit
MNEWTSSPVSKLAEITSGGTPSRIIDEFWNGDIPWVTPTDITACRTNYLHDTKEKITAKGLAASSATLLPKGSLLFTSRATIGEMKIAVNPVATNQGFKSLSPKPSVDGLFLFYQVCRLKSEFIRFGAGSTFPEINRKDTARVEIPHPVNPTVQKKISTILQTIDEAIEQTEALIEKFSLVKAGMMHDLFTRGLTPDGKLRPPREEAPDLYKETPIGWIPKEWDTSHLAAKSLPGTQHLKTGPFGSSLKGEHWVNEGHPVITIGALGEGEFTASELLFIGDNDAKRLSYFKLKEGEVVFSRVADVGRSVVIEEDQVGWIMSSNLMRIALNKKSALPHFLQLQLATDSRLKKQIRQKVNAGGRDVANSDILNRLLFVWPDPDEQKAIVERAMAIENRTRAERTKLKKLYDQKTGLMHDLLTGEVLVEAVKPEAAHV